ncbi:MAG: hypothetical protein IKZ41_03770 [Clostridia bacterium]|nr:hypothetical protein [Clostridia bacterium]
MKKKTLLSLLLVFSLLFSLCACGKGKKKAGDILSKEPLTGMLTGVYRAEEFVLPEEWTVRASIPPICENGVTRLVGMKQTEREDEDGTITEEIEYTVFTLADGQITDAVPLAVPGDQTLERGAFSCGGDRLVFLVSERANHGEMTLLSRDLPTGEEKSLEHAQDFLPSLAAGPYAYVSALTVDAEGRIAIASENEIAVFDADLLFQYSLTTPQHFDSLVALSDGRFWISMNQSIVPVEENGLGGKVSLPNAWGRIAAGSGYDFYASTSTGVYGANFADGQVEYDLLMDYLNSDCAGLLFLGAADPDTLIFSDGLYRHAEDIDLSSIRTLELASAQSLDMGLPALIIAFNRAHDDARIVIRDYSIYQTDSDPDGAIRNLSMDIATGILKPELVIGNPDASYMRYIYDEALWLDLAPFMKDDPTVNRDNIFGGVWNSFSADGQIWGLPAGYLIGKFLTTTTAVVGRDMNRWTLGEFLDFAENLPEDTMLLENLTQGNWSMLFSTDSLAGFIDRGAGTCSFDSPEFVRFLNWLKTLPKDKAEALKRYPEIMNADKSERIRFYQEGKIALYARWIVDVSDLFTLDAQWGTPDWLPIGSPVPEGHSGIDLSPLNVITATRYCAEPELAWAFIRSVFESIRDTIRGGTLPVMKSSFDAQAEQMMKTERAVYYDGSGEVKLKSEGDPLTLRKPGMILDFTEKTAEKLKTILDTAGSPVMESVPNEIDEIIREEISAFFADAASAEDCAAKIQSRVSIWLAEHR